MNELLKQMQEDASVVPENNLGKIGAVATDIAETEEEIAKLKAQLKKKEEYVTKLSEQVLPTLFSEVGLSELKLSEYFRASIKVENRELAYTWLKNNGFGDLIKNQITCSFGRNEEEKASSLVSDLNEKGLEPTQREWVESSTLRAFVREQYEKGVDLPMELLGAYVGQKTTIKSE